MPGKTRLAVLRGRWDGNQNRDVLLFYCPEISAYFSRGERSFIQGDFIQFTDISFSAVCAVSSQIQGGRNIDIFLTKITYCKNGIDIKIDDPVFPFADKVMPFSVINRLNRPAEAGQTRSADICRGNPMLDGKIVTGIERVPF